MTHNIKQKKSEFIIIDSCVFLKTLFEENYSKIAVDLMDKIANHGTTIIVPDLFICEVYATCAAKKFPYENVFFALEKYKKSLLKIVNPSENVLKKAFEITQDGHAKSGFPSFYDSLYHALAIEQKCTFVTADEKHFTKTHKKFGHIKLLKNA